MSCYLCSNDTVSVITNKLRYGETRKVLQCQACGLVFLEPQAAPPREYYESDQYRTRHGPVTGRLLGSREIFEMYWPYQQPRIDELESILTPEMRVLEVGCSAGYFLYALKRYVKECVGIEFNRDDAKFVAGELGITTYTEPLEETGLPLQHFDLIAVPHVLHLMEDPLRFLATISRYLTPAGYLWIELPNVEDALLSVYRNAGYRDFYFKEPYLFYYSVKTLSRLVDRAGFDGTVKTVQSYTLLNHMHWLLTGAPQESAKEGMSLPMIVSEGAVAPSVANELNDWLQKIDSQYKEYLNRHDLGDTLSFIGRKACG